MADNTIITNIVIEPGIYYIYTSSGSGSSMKMYNSGRAFKTSRQEKYAGISVSRVSVKDNSAVLSYSDYISLTGKLSQHTNGVSNAWVKVESGKITLSNIITTYKSGSIPLPKKTEDFFGDIVIKAGKYVCYEIGSDGYPTSKQLYSFQLVRDITIDNCDTTRCTINGTNYFRVNNKIDQVIVNSGVLKGGGWLKQVSGITTKKKDKAKTSYSTSAALDLSNNGPNYTELPKTDIEGVIKTSTTANIANGRAHKILDSYDDLMISSINGIFGVPYQWNELADRCLPGKDKNSPSFGRKYAEKIAARMPLLFLTPCRPAFLAGATKKQKDNVLSALNSIGGNDDKSREFLDVFIGDAADSGITKYYTTNFAYAEYYRYVNPMCQMTAKMLELDINPETRKKGRKVTINGEKVDLTSFDWSKSLSGDFSKYWSSSNSIPFYINANSTFSESISNDTTKSAIDTSMESYSAKAKELQFLLGTASSASNGGVVSDATNYLSELISSVGSNKSAANFLSNVGASMSTIATGGALMFPEIWSDSSMSRSYNIDIKLRSPDADNLSIYLNILVPLYHLMALAAPQMIGNNYNAYSSPFLIKAYFKSGFNIDMGIITSMDISKGKEGAWNANGLPTEVDITLGIKDLYDTFCLTGFTNSTDIDKGLGILNYMSGKLDQGTRILKNTAMMDYLCNNAGLNLNQNAASRTLTLYTLLRKNAITTWPNNQWLKLQGFVDTKMKNILTNRG